MRLGLNFFWRTTVSTERHCARPPAPRPSERRPRRASFAPLAPPLPPPTSPPPSPSSPSTPWTGAPWRSVIPCDARGESASRWWGCGAGPQGSPAVLEGARRGRPCGACSRVPSDGAVSADRPRRTTPRRRPSPFAGGGQRHVATRLFSGRPSGGRSPWNEVQVRGGRPPGEGERGEGGRLGTSTGEHGTGASRGGRLRPRPAPSRGGCTSPAGRPGCVPCGTRCRSAGVVRRGREHAARAAGRARPRGKRGGWRGGRRIRSKVRGGVSRSESGECLALAAGTVGATGAAGKSRSIRRWRHRGLNLPRASSGAAGDAGTPAAFAETSPADFRLPDVFLTRGSNKFSTTGNRFLHILNGHQCFMFTLIFLLMSLTLIFLLMLSTSTAWTSRYRRLRGRRLLGR